MKKQDMKPIRNGMKKKFRRSAAAGKIMSETAYCGGALADMLGVIASKIKPLKKDEEEFKAELIALCRKRNRAFDGDKYRATVSFSKDCETLNQDMVRKLLTPAQIKRCTEYGDRVTVRVFGLKTS